MRLGNKEIGEGFPTYVVAEIGQNHQGDVYTAIRLVAMAVKAGVDAVKFQYRCAEAEYTPEQLAAPHPNPHNAFGATYGEHRAALDLTLDDLRHIRDRITYNNWPVDFFVTPCFAGGVRDLEALGMPFYKIASKSLGDSELLDAVALTGKPMILSTGKSEIEDIVDALGTIRARDNADNVCLMQCSSVYPCPFDQVNLRAIGTLKDFFGLDCGFSDHTGTPYVVGGAVASGAAIVEAHVTFSKRMKGTDHAASLEPDELVQYVRTVRAMDRAMGDGIKRRIRERAAG